MLEARCIENENSFMLYSNFHEKGIFILKIMLENIFLII